MASTETGELFTDEQYKNMSVKQRSELKIVGITSEESTILSKMSRFERRKWMRENKKFKHDKVAK